MITIRCTKNFFDRASVIAAVGKVQAQKLAKAGAYVRTAARSSMRRRKAPSAPGSPPSVHSKDSFATLRNILFAWDKTTESVVIGPVAINQSSFVQRTAAKGAVPQVQEFGGTLGTFEVQRRDGAWYRAGLRSRRSFAGRPTRIRQARYQPRPYMGPALRQEMPKFPDLWKNSVIRGM